MHDPRRFTKSYQPAAADSTNNMPPANYNAERAVLGAILLHEEGLDQVSDILAPEDFYTTAHQDIFKSMLELARSMKRIDLLTLQDDLTKKQALESIGGMAYLVSLHEDIPPVGLIKQHAKIVKEKAFFRNMLSKAYNIIEVCHTQDEKVLKKVLSSVEKEISDIKQQHNLINAATQECPAIEFLGTMEKNYLLEDAPELPSLINIRKGQSTSTFIARGIVGCVVGVGGLCKSNYVAQLALALATKKDFLGEYPVKEKGRAIIIFGEDSKDDNHRLLRRTVKGLYGFNGKTPADKRKEIEDASDDVAVMSVHGTDASFIDKNGKPTPFYYKLLDNLMFIANQPKGELALIVIDPASRFFGPMAEADNAAATQFIALLESITQKVKGNPTVLFVHHMNKSALSGTETNQGSIRGSSALTDGSRLQINLEMCKNPKTGEFDRHSVWQKMAKSNYTQIIEDEVIVKDPLNGFLKIDNTFREFYKQKAKTKKKSEEPEDVEDNHTQPVTNTAKYSPAQKPLATKGLLKEVAGK